jgi:hypothetical protein
MTVKHSKRLDEQDHKLLAVWASDCAERVLKYFEEVHPEDDRPRKAIEAARAWVRGDLTMVEARKAAFASHASARDAKHAPAQSAARAAGHAAATAHVASHARHAAAYAIKSVGDAADVERDWQHRSLPEHLHPVVFTASRQSN